MQSLRNAFQFINESLKLAFSHTQLRKTWLNFFFGSFVLLIIWFLPIGVVVGFIGFSPVGLIMTGGLGFFFFCSLLIWGKIVTLKTCQAAAKVISEDPEAFSSPSNISYSHWPDVLQFMLVLPGAIIKTNLKNLFQKDSNYAQQSWLTDKFLVLPVISLEDLSLSKALERVKQIIKDNLVRIKPSLVPVSLVVKVLQWFFILCGVILGIGLADIIILNPTMVPPWYRILGTGMGTIVIWFLTVIGILFNTFSCSCYHTSLYLWVQNAEKARKNRESHQASPPKILQKVLGTTSFSKKEE